MSVLLPMAAVAGKKVSGFYAYFGAPGAIGVHRISLRNPRSVDSAGVNRLRWCDANDHVYITSGVYTAGTNWAYMWGEDCQSYGKRFNYDRVRRRHQGNATGRLARARLEFTNKVDVGGLWVRTRVDGEE